jgi:hypothetical protein
LGRCFEEGFQSAGGFHAKRQVFAGRGEGCDWNGWATLSAVVQFVFMLRFDFTVSRLNAVKKFWVSACCCVHWDVSIRAVEVVLGEKRWFSWG